MFAHPIMVRTSMVGNYIEDQPHAEVIKLAMERVEVVPASNGGVRFVSLIGKWQPGHIVEGPPRQPFALSCKQRNLSARKLSSFWRPRPHSNQIKESNPDR